MQVVRHSCGQYTRWRRGNTWQRVTVFSLRRLTYTGLQEGGQPHKRPRGDWEMRVRESSTFMHACAEKYRQQCVERLNEMRASMLRATPMAICAWFAAVAMGVHAGAAVAASAEFPTPLPADTIPKV